MSKWPCKQAYHAAKPTLQDLLLSNKNNTSGPSWAIPGRPAHRSPGHRHNRKHPFPASLPISLPTIEHPAPSIEKWPLAKIAKDAKGSGFAGTGVNGGGTFLRATPGGGSPAMSFERGTKISPFRNYLCAALRALRESFLHPFPSVKSVVFLLYPSIQHPASSIEHPLHFQQC